MKKQLLAAALALSIAGSAMAHDHHAHELSLSVIGQYQTGIFDDSAAEIVAHDPRTQRIFAVNASAASLQESVNLGRLKVTTANGDSDGDGDGDFDTLYSYGARSFSIRDAFGRLLFDSGDEIERTLAAALPGNFNSNIRSDNDSCSRRSWHQD